MTALLARRRTATKRAVRDFFTRADSTTSLGSTTTGEAWTQLRGTWGISSNQAYRTTNNAAGDMAVVDLGSADQIVSVQIATLSAGEPGLCVRVTDADNCYIVFRTSGNVALYKRVAGVSTIIGSNTAAVFRDGDRLGVKIVGSTITISKNGIVVRTATDSSIASGNKAGLWGGGTASAATRWDNFIAMPNGGPAVDFQAVRTLDWLQRAIDWKTTNSVGVCIGEIGWPYGSSAYDTVTDTNWAAWNDLADAYVKKALAAGIDLSYSAVFEMFDQYKIAAYNPAHGTSTVAPLSVAEHPATVIESNPRAGGVRFGIMLAGGDQGDGVYPVNQATNAGFSNARENGWVFDAAGVTAMSSAWTGFGMTNVPYAKAWNYGTAASFTFLASRTNHVDFVRMPFRMERVYRTLGGALDTTELGRLDAAIAAAAAAGLQVILDAHNYGYYYLDDGSQGVRQSIGGATFTAAHFTDFWTKMSQHFKGMTGLLGYDLQNEPIGATGWSTISQNALNAIRGNVDNALILVQTGTQWSKLPDVSSVTPWITDSASNFQYELHHYWDSLESSGYDETYASRAATP